MLFTPSEMPRLCTRQKPESVAYRQKFTVCSVVIIYACRRSYLTKMSVLLAPIERTTSKRYQYVVNCTILRQFVPFYSVLYCVFVHGLLDESAGSTTNTLFIQNVCFGTTDTVLRVQLQLDLAIYQSNDFTCFKKNNNNSARQF